MCDYCGCRCIGPIGELSEEHLLIDMLAGQLRRHIVAGDETAAGAVLRELQAVLGPHLAKEEGGLVAQLADREGFQWYLGQLNADHTRARPALLAASSSQLGWAAGVLAGLDELAEHIKVEEYDLFPASRVIIDDAGWAQVVSAHRQFATPLPAPAHAR